MRRKVLPASTARGDLSTSPRGSSASSHALIRTQFTGIQKTFLDYLQILGLTGTALNKVIVEKQFRSRSRRLHPDKSANDAEKFKEINEAYEEILTALEKQDKINNPEVRTSAIVYDEIEELKKEIKEAEESLIDDYKRLDAVSQLVREKNEIRKKNKDAMKEEQLHYNQLLLSQKNQELTERADTFKRLYSEMVRDDGLSFVKTNFLNEILEVKGEYESITIKVDDLKPKALFSQIEKSLGADLFLQETFSPDSKSQAQYRNNNTYIFSKSPVALYFLKDNVFVKLKIDEVKFLKIIEKLPGNNKENQPLQSYLQKNQVDLFLDLIKSNPGHKPKKDDGRTARAWRTLEQDPTYQSNMAAMKKSHEEKKALLDSAKEKYEVAKKSWQESLVKKDVIREVIETSESETIPQQKSKLEALKKEAEELKMKESQEAKKTKSSKKTSQQDKNPGQGSSSSAGSSSGGLSFQENGDLNKKVEAFKKIYQALRLAQTGSFTNFLSGKSKLTGQEFWDTVEKYVVTHPGSRTKQAYDLTLKFYNTKLDSNIELYSKIYHYGYRKSSFFRSPLKETKPQFFQDDNQLLTQQDIDEGLKDETSRRAKIFKALKG